MNRIALVACFYAAGSAAWAALSPAPGQIDFVRDIQPIFEASCVKCHGHGRDKGGFRLDTRETFLRGGESGAAAKPGRSSESRIIELVSGFDPESVMPAKGSRLTPAQVSALRAWIDQGLAWPAGVSFGRTPARNLHPRRPELPPVRAGLTNPVDRLLAPYFEAQGIKSDNSVTEDRVYARRVWFDLVGLPPPPAELAQFVADSGDEKRGRLVMRLLADRRAFAEHWLTFWNDLLRNEYKGAAASDGLRSQISGFLYSALVENLPYDRFVAELVCPTRRDSAGFINGIRWRGDLSASQQPAVQAAQNVAQVFLGANLKCASCHDSFVSDWSLADAYGMAAVFAEQPRLELFQCDRATGRRVGARFLFPELGEIPADAPGDDRVRRLAEIMTSPQNGRLTRTIVNRLWAVLFGRGLVEPVDDLDQPAWHPDLLDWLAEDLAAHGYDLKRTLQLMATSRAYQMPAMNLDESAGRNYVFRGPAIRRLTAEQFRDAIGAMTGVWHPAPDADCDFTAGLEPQERVRLLPRPWRWIWSKPDAAQGAEYGSVFFYKSFRLSRLPDDAIAVGTADSAFTLYVNGVRALSGAEWQKVASTNILPLLVAGENIFAVAARNLPEHAGATTPVVRKPAGFTLYARLRRGTDVSDIGTDASWKCTTNRALAMNADGADPKGLQPVAELGELAMPPWAMGRALTAELSKVLMRGKTRAGLVSADPLALAMGRPLREQVVSVRSSAATTLQGIEFLNGATFDELLDKGAAELLATGSKSGADLVREVFVRALGRPPGAAELQHCSELLGAQPGREQVRDLLWSIALLPEFQLLY